MLEYETANPGQDFDEKEHQAFDPDRDTSRPNPIVDITSKDDFDRSKRANFVPVSSDGVGEHEHYGPATSGSQDSESARDGAGVTAVKGKRKEAGYSTYREAIQTPTQELAYQVAADVESGNYEPRSAGHA